MRIPAQFYSELLSTLKERGRPEYIFPVSPTEKPPARPPYLAEEYDRAVAVLEMKKLPPAQRDGALNVETLGKAVLDAADILKSTTDHNRALVSLQATQVGYELVQRVKANESTVGLGSLRRQTAIKALEIINGLTSKGFLGRYEVAEAMFQTMAKLAVLSKGQPEIERFVELWDRRIEWAEDRRISISREWVDDRIQEALALTETKPRHPLRDKAKFWQKLMHPAPGEQAA